MGAQLSELCPGQTPEVSADPHGEGTTPSHQEKTANDKDDGWECLPEEVKTAKTDKPKKRAGKDKTGSSKDMNIEVNHEDLAQRRALLQRELVQIEKIEKQARQQSQQHPDESEEEG